VSKENYSENWKIIDKSRVAGSRMRRRDAGAV
jgi:hypothetical protein